MSHGTFKGVPNDDDKWPKAFINLKALKFIGPKNEAGDCQFHLLGSPSISLNMNDGDLAETIGAHFLMDTDAIDFGSFPEFSALCPQHISTIQPHINIAGKWCIWWTDGSTPLVISEDTLREILTRRPFGHIYIKEVRTPAEEPA